jgi:hypothetical protein
MHLCGSLLYVLLVGNRQVPTALSPAAGQHFAAILGAHALTEAVLVHSFTLGRLISPFHFIVILQLSKQHGFFSGAQR